MTRADAVGRLLAGRTLIVLFVAGLASACANLAAPGGERASAPAGAEGPQMRPAAAIETVASPNGRLVMELVSAGGSPRYRVLLDGEEVVGSSALGLRFASGANLDADLSLAAVSRAEADETWEQPWGERRLVRDVHSELAARFDRPDGTEGFTLRARVFNDGLGFRYETPGPAGRTRVVVDETTEFVLDPTATAWWIPAGGWNRYEELYRTTDLADVSRAHTPFTAKLPSGVHVAIHEAALVDYSGMWLNQRRSGVLRSELAPSAEGGKATVRGAFKTPWRTIQVADTAVGLVNSDLILNLNESNALGDVSWVEPGRYVGIWWCMHVNACTWGSGDIHGATTERTKAHIDFAAEHGFAGVLVEGWNEGWDGDWFSNGDVFSFTQPYPDFDIEAIAAYAQSKGVRLIGHHETSGSISNYEAQLDAAFDLYERLGVAQVKTGYVADGGELKRRDARGDARMEWHDGQASVAHHIKVLEAAAKRRISINTHEPVKDTGLRRTYPNWLSREGARGQEYNAWNDPPNPPEHVPLLVFTRMLSGPMDFTPGIVDLDIGRGYDAPIRVQTTLAKQLALYVVLYSPIQMAADLPANYEARPDALSFISAVPTDWEQSIALAGEVGEFAVIARQRRGGRDWYLGAVTDEAARALPTRLDFLEPGVRYRATLWTDPAGADWRTNPEVLEVTERTVTAADTLGLDLAPGGGAAVMLTPID